MFGALISLNCGSFAELALREKLTQQVKELTADLEQAKQSTKGRKSLAPKFMDDKINIGPASETDRPAAVGESLADSVDGGGQPAPVDASASKEEEAQAEEAAKNKENLVNVSSAKLVGTVT